MEIGFCYTVDFSSCFLLWKIEFRRRSGLAKEGFKNDLNNCENDSFRTFDDDRLGIIEFQPHSKLVMQQDRRYREP